MNFLKEKLDKITWNFLNEKSLYLFLNGIRNFPSYRSLLKKKLLPIKTIDDIPKEIVSRYFNQS